MEIGIIGLPQSGKTSIYNALTGLNVELGYAGSRKKANHGVAKIPDVRLDKLCEMFNPKSTVNATVDYIDIGGLSGEGKSSEGFSADFLQAIKSCEAILLVIRSFFDPQMPHADGPPNPEAEIALAEQEFLFSDLAICENRIVRLKKQLMKIKDKELAFELSVIEKCYESLEKEQPLRLLELDHFQLKVLRSYSFLTLKPILIVLNIDEDKIGEEETLKRIQKDSEGKEIRVCQVCAKIEMELAQMDEEDALEFLEEYGIKERALDMVLHESSELLHLLTFFTVGEDECRAWNIKQNSTAPIAAGAIHSDIQRGFIRAEVVGCQELLDAGSFSACKERGTFRLEGKEYIVKEGEIVHFRFNV
jgi:ribosome-binding ATPase